MIEFRLPSLGADMDEGKLLEWRVQPGDEVKKGQVVCVVDTVKAAIDVECWHDGILHALLVEPGTTVPVGTPLAMLREEGDSAEAVDRAMAAIRAEAGSRARPAPEIPTAPAPAPAPAKVPPSPATAAAHAAPPDAPLAPPAATPAPRPAAAPAPSPVSAPAPPATAPTATTPRRVSPAARKRAAELGIDLAGIQPGADGTVALAEVERAAAPSPPAAVARAAAPPAEPTGAPTRVETQPSTTPATMAERAAQMRKVIGAAMARSKREIPHYYLAEDVPLIAATAWLDERNAERGVSDRLLLAPLLLKSVAAALHRYPEFNGYCKDGAFVAGEGIHIGVAISLRAGGLVTPALMDVDCKDIDEVNRDLLDLIRRTRAGSLRASELSAGTITVTSLGEQGVAAVYGVIYPPQVALVGFGRPTERPCAVDGGLRVGAMITATLAADHRVSDGHRGGLFLAAIRDLLQNPDELKKASP